MHITIYIYILEFTTIFLSYIYKLHDIEIINK